ncbi:hypothetical protein K5F93_11900 [Pseudomonas protegens]|uniref:hypothetical protein n=1 Tax=Pseudomonas protegens TaxID=380021 RepID=UPI001C8DC219|nr:hypothetical protein [Pseudomonas protegens]QZI72872.1 hypothetical protein K5F93_11580 [Pseudomonas protegens]QZI72911.1 hypothetical protein K5F93_11900 [Pseudomonas protegens]
MEKIRQKFAEVRSGLAGQMIQGEDWASAYRAADEMLSFESFRLGWKASRKTLRITNPFPAQMGDPDALWAREVAEKSLRAQGLKVVG